MRQYLLPFIFCIASAGLCAQDSAFGLKGGFSAAFQKWNDFQRDPLLTSHIIAYIESAPEDNSVALFGQFGFHNRGSAVVIRPFSYIDQTTGADRRYPGSTTKYQFRNLSLSLGAKQKFELAADKYYYYMLGIRGDYTLNTNLDDFEQLNSFTNTLFYPQDDYVRKFNYGLIIGGGLEFHFTEFIGGLVELTVNPDLSKQYEQFPIPNVYDPYTGQTRTLPGRDIRNLTLELSVGIRLLRKVEYID